MDAPSKGDAKLNPYESFEQHVPGQKINFYELMDKMIGSKKQRFSDVVVPYVGIPQPARPPEEVRIAAVMESCAFKTTMSCVIGKTNIDLFSIQVIGLSRHLTYPILYSMSNTFYNCVDYR